MWPWSRSPTLVVRVQLPLEWHPYLLSNPDIGNFEWKTNEGEARSIILLIFLQPLSVGEGWRWGQKVSCGANRNRICLFLGFFSQIGSAESQSAREV